MAQCKAADRKILPRKLSERRFWVHPGQIIRARAKSKCLPLGSREPSHGCSRPPSARPWGSPIPIASGGGAHPLTSSLLTTHEGKKFKCEFTDDFLMEDNASNPSRSRRSPWLAWARGMTYPQSPKLPLPQTQGALPCLPSSTPARLDPSVAGSQAPVLRHGRSLITARPAGGTPGRAGGAWGWRLETT